MNERVARVRDNLLEVQGRIDQALARSNRKERPQLLVASKYLDTEEMGILAGAGIRLVGGEQGK